MTKENNPTDNKEKKDEALAGGIPAGDIKAEAGDLKTLDIKESEEYKALQDKYLRLAAEFDNYKKRSAREYAQIRELAASDLILEQIRVADDFRRALQHDSSDFENYRQGMKLIFNKLQEILQKKGVSEIDSIGEPFNPKFHEAILQVEVGDQDDGIIVDEIEKGYMLNDRVLRPARVVVAKRKTSDDNALEYSDSDNE